jgi:hypothetical protein
MISTNRILVAMTGMDSDHWGRLLAGSRPIVFEPDGQLIRRSALRSCGNTSRACWKNCRT